MDLLLRQVYLPECDAWKRALKEREKLKGLGFDVTQTITQQELFAKIREDLLGYRKGLTSLGVIFPSSRSSN